LGHRIESCHQSNQRCAGLRWLRAARGAAYEQTFMDARLERGGTGDCHRTRRGRGICLHGALFDTPGVTLVDVSKLMDDAIHNFCGDGSGCSGNPLYTYDADQPGRSSCYAECAKEFPPFMADAHARASGDFSVIARDGHSGSGLSGNPLYRYSGKTPTASQWERASSSRKTRPGWIRRAIPIRPRRWRRAASRRRTRL